MRSDLRVLLMSGYAGDALEGRGLGGAGGAFLRKPLTPTVLTRKVREVLDGGRNACGDRPVPLKTRNSDS